jgi:tight adherence protein C
VQRSGEVLAKRSRGHALTLSRIAKELVSQVESGIGRRLEDARSAGIPEHRLRSYLLVSVAAPLGSFVLGMSLIGVAGGVLAAIAALVAVDSSLRRAIEAERVRFRRSFPDAIDLLAIACMAGMNAYRAFRTVGKARPAGCERIFEALDADLSSGATVSDALRHISMETRFPELAALSRAISGAERLGHPLGPALMRLAADLRERQVRQAQAAARKAPIKVLFPLVFCILPAFVLLTVVPVLADTFAVIRQ